MFTVIKTVYLKPKKRFNSFLKPGFKHSIEKIKINNSYYYKFTVKTYKKKINWKRIFKTVNLSDFPLIFPENEPLPKGVRYSLFDSDVFYKTVLINSLKKHCGQNQKIFLFDPLAENSDFLYPLLQSFKQVCVFCDNETAYSSVNNNAQSVLGTSAVFSTNTKIAKEFDAVLNLTDIPLLFSHPLVFGTSGFNFSPHALKLPKNIARLIPAKINPLTFASALFELCSVTELKNVTPAYLTNELTQTVLSLS